MIVLFILYNLTWFRFPHCCLIGALSITVSRFNVFYGLRLVDFQDKQESIQSPTTALLSSVSLTKLNLLSQVLLSKYCDARNLDQECSDTLTHSVHTHTDKTREPGAKSLYIYYVYQQQP